MKGIAIVLALFITIDFVNGQCPPGCGYPTVWANFSGAAGDGSSIDNIRSSLKWWFPTPKGGTPVKPPPVLYTNLNGGYPEFIVQSPTKIRFTMVFEDAGNNNQAGIFFYDKNTQTGAVTVSRYQLVLPQVKTSCFGNGGPTISTEVLPAGTRLGFYFIPDGYCQTSKTYWHSIPSLNNGTNADVNGRHVAVYYDKQRDLYILGWDDLPLTNTASDGDFDDNVFMIDSTGTPLQVLNVPTICNGGCLNGGVCDYSAGDCQCIKGFTGKNCEVAACDDGNPCTRDIFSGPTSCPQSDWRSPDSCTATQSCKHEPIPCPTSAPSRAPTSATSRATSAASFATSTPTSDTPAPEVITKNVDSDALIGVAAGLAFVATALILLVIFLVLRNRNSGFSKQVDQ